jgi:hypothetical protein
VSGWKTLAEPTYGVTGTGIAVLIPAGSEIEILGPSDGLPGTVEAVARREDRAAERDEYSDVLVTESALRFAGSR